MSGKRTARLNEQFKREISDILHREVRDPRVGLPTVTGVDATPDLWLAKIFVRPGPGEEERDEEGLLEGLAAAASFIRRELGDRLVLRRIPELRFEVDRTLDEAMRIERILREVLPGEEVDPEDGSGDAGAGPEDGDPDGPGGAG